MRTRTTVAVALIGLVAIGSATPSYAKTKPKPKPIRGSYTATAYPDPTSTSPLPGSEPCKPNLPTAMFSKRFTIPAAGTLHVELNNKLDWSIAVRDLDGTAEGTADGGTPNVREMVDVTFKKKQAVNINTCNFSGEPSVTVSYVFTYK